VNRCVSFVNLTPTCSHDDNSQRSVSRKPISCQSFWITCFLQTAVCMWAVRRCVFRYLFVLIRNLWTTNVCVTSVVRIFPLSEEYIVGGVAVIKDKRHVYKLSRCQAVWSLTVFDNKRKVQRALIRTRETGYISRRYLFSVVWRSINNSYGSSLSTRNIFRYSSTRRHTVDCSN